MRSALPIASPRCRLCSKRDRLFFEAMMRVLGREMPGYRD